MAGIMFKALQCNGRGATDLTLKQPFDVKAIQSSWIRRVIITA